LKLADIARDEKLLKYARDVAIELFEKDPDLKSPQNRPMVNHLNNMWKNRTDWGLIS